MHGAARPKEIIVTPSRVCELKFNGNDVNALNAEVTPSRVCELKFHCISALRGETGHTLTGV